MLRPTLSVFKVNIRSHKCDYCSGLCLLQKFTYLGIDKNNQSIILQSTFEEKFRSFDFDFIKTLN